MIGLQTFARWFIENPLGGAGTVYAAAILGVMLYTFVTWTDL